jgi:predicted DNA-binding transcriptional regulator AlpA
MEYDFTLKFKLQAATDSIEQLIERLGEAGCDDATVGMGPSGRIALNFTREAPSASDAVLSAIRDIRGAIPGAELIEAAPDYVGLTDVADLVGMSRQNLRKLMASHLDFPTPVHTGTHSQVWHLENVLQWLQARATYQIEPQLIEVAQVAQQCNLAREASKLEPAAQQRLRELVA